MTANGVVEYLLDDTPSAVRTDQPSTGAGKDFLFNIDGNQYTNDPLRRPSDG
jgi:hypothetical protein